MKSSLTMRYLAFMLCISLVFSCTPQKDDPGTDPGPGTGTDTVVLDPNGTKLAKVIVFTYTQPKQYIEVFEYHYDNLNRITEITYAKGDSVNGKIEAPNSIAKKFLYNGNEQLPYRSTGSVPTDVTEDIYHFYDNNGRSVTDSMPASHCNCYTTKKRQWLSDKTIAQTVTYDSRLGFLISVNDTSLISNNNISTQTKWDNTNGQTAFYRTYDNKTNPLNKLNVQAAISFMITGGVPTPAINKNNITDYTYGIIQTTGLNAGTFLKRGAITYTYSYNNAGMPIECEFSETGSTPGKIKFYYTK
ncbi:MULTISPECIES: hypothetical protein [Niastella]|uniref:DUF4595 domain-containing protein n=1 Tax=Niastella soli TaxID=2821487 RepID=A0ABS3YV00_9BACT|nr:hypothetical protein [Niastella soli]MBO9201749.1 hypothetical protein [Niastella soli]